MGSSSCLRRALSSYRINLLASCSMSLPCTSTVRSLSHLSCSSSGHQPTNLPFSSSLGRRCYNPPSHKMKVLNLASASTPWGPRSSLQSISPPGRTRGFNSARKRTTRVHKMHNALDTTMAETREGPLLEKSPRPWRGPLPPKPAPPPLVGEALEEIRQAQRKLVLEYLESDWGIDTEELDDVELPADSQIMRERLEYLQNLGVDPKEVVDQYPPLLGCTISRNFKPVVDYLETLGITGSDLSHLVSSYPRVLYSSVVVELQPHIKFIEGLGVRPDKVGEVLAKYPDILSFRLEGTPSTSVAFLVSIGVQLRAVGPMVTMCPQLLGMRVANNIKPKVEFLESLGISRPRIAEILERKPALLLFALDKQMRPAVEALQQLGIPQDEMAQVVGSCPNILEMDVERTFARKAKQAEELVGIGREDFLGMVRRFSVLLAIDSAKLGARTDYLLEAGIPKEGVAAMLIHCPEIATLSVLNILKPHVDYLVGMLGRSVLELVDYPEFFTHNISTVIEPRIAAFGERAALCSLSWMLSCNEEQMQIRLASGVPQRAA